MKRGISILLIILTIGFISLVLAQTVDNPTAGLESATGGTLTQEGINTDNINQTAQQYKSKAEMRIDAINKWLDDNASWLDWIFGMTPGVSWLFAINFLTILTFIVYFRNILAFFSFFSETTAAIIGVLLAFLAVHLKITVTLAKWITHISSKWWVQLVAVIGIIIVIILASFLSKIQRKARKNQEEFQQKIDRELLHEEVESGKNLFKPRKDSK